MKPDPPFMSPQNDVTQALLDVGAGDEAAGDRLWALVYDELRAVAHRQLRGERADHTLSTTALVHEAYLKLVDQTRIQWQNRAQFFGVAAQAMRRILVDYARSRRRQKRGGGIVPVSLDGLEDGLAVSDAQIEETLVLDEALQKLEGHNERLSKLVELRYFGGLTEEETAEILGVSVRTVRRDWVRAKGWLLYTLGSGEAEN